LTGIVGTFFVKDYLGLSAAFLAALGFWAGIPWVLKMPLGHLVDLFWRWKSALVFLGAGLIAVSLLIVAGLLAYTEAMLRIWPTEIWYVMSVLLAPVGYVIQDVVADAMTVEAVPQVDEEGRPIEPSRRRLMHTTMQTLGRVAIIGGAAFVSIVNILMFQGVESMPQTVKVSVYLRIYLIALVDTALESPLGQIAMIPMLAWIANSAPRELKATFFAVMASFTNLALSLSQLGTKYLNEIYTVTRQVKDAAGAVVIAADYSELGKLLITTTVIGLVLPVAAIILVKLTPLKGVGDTKGDHTD